MDAFSDVFYRHFEILEADSPRLCDQLFKLRYQVFCVENHYLDASRYPDGRETDEFDPRALHGMVRHRRSGSCVAGVRLVMPDPEDASRPLPMEDHGGYEVARHLTNRASIPRQSLAEISRFSVSKDFRRRAGEAYMACGVGDEAIYADPAQLELTRRLFPHTILGLFAAIVRMSARSGVTHWCAVIEPALLRLLSRFGIRFRALGHLVDYYGQRQPVLGVIDEVLAGIHADRPDVWAMITENGSLWPVPAGARGQPPGRKGADWSLPPFPMFVDPRMRISRTPL
jgi:N-acyl amino acid synthase of PEP-CTERM/exosortase system